MSKTAGLTGYIRTHSLRAWPLRELAHTFIENKAGEVFTAIELVKHIAHHKDVRTTKRYIGELQIDFLTSRLEQAKAANDLSMPSLIAPYKRPRITSAEIDLALSETFTNPAGATSNDRAAVAIQAVSRVLVESYRGCMRRQRLR
ncbi:uncharacterized protein DSM5745_01786 [Aspergillus mulundensis]|uniref:Uncharacterized protein n=1 Tax=Aspergillus mulundensis TaxID=1810919 RepID=A0A3D8SV03_9EURO|nr:hypothetical protein DSM5745_01786 [Aspergillus mulundensis]RDW90011.1 hypothetical protein DSM5745_01786 [Aspergillus mulundensis]